MANRSYQIIGIANFLKNKNIKITYDVLEKCKYYLEHDYGRRLENISEKNLRKQLSKFIQTQSFEKRDITV